MRRRTSVSKLWIASHPHNKNHACQGFWPGWRTPASLQHTLRIEDSTHRHTNSGCADAWDGRTAPPRKTVTLATPLSKTRVSARMVCGYNATHCQGTSLQPPSLACVMCHTTSAPLPCVTRTGSPCSARPLLHSAMRGLLLGRQTCLCVGCGPCHTTCTTYRAHYSTVHHLKHVAAEALEISHTTYES